MLSQEYLEVATIIGNNKKESYLKENHWLAAAKQQRLPISGEMKSKKLSVSKSYFHVIDTMFGLFVLCVTCLTTIYFTDLF